MITDNIVKPVENRHSHKDKKLFFKTNYHLMQIKSIALEHSAILQTFIKLQSVIKIFVLSIFKRPFYTGFTVLAFRLTHF